MSFAKYVADLEITPGRAYAPFWSALIQVLRNTMDHQAQAGHAGGQSTQSAIRVTTSVTSDHFTVTVENDGPRADWNAVRNACVALGGSVEVEPLKNEGTRLSFAFAARATEHKREAARHDGRRDSTRLAFQRRVAGAG